MTERTKCPKCGGTDGWERVIRITGIVVEVGAWGSSQHSESTGLDSAVRGRMPKTVRCLQCGHRTTAEGMIDD